MVGFLLDGRERDPATRALAEDVARSLASDEVQTHRLELVPTPLQRPHVLYTAPGSPASSNTSQPETGRPSAAQLEGLVQTTLDSSQLVDCAGKLASEVAEIATRRNLTSLHGLGLGLAGLVAQLTSKKTGIPYCVTPVRADLRLSQEDERLRARGVMRDAQHVIFFDESFQQSVETAFPIRSGEPSPRLRTLRRGVDLDFFKALPRQERPRAAAQLDTRSLIAERLQDIDWRTSCTVLCLQTEHEVDGFEQFLFALPEVIRQQPALQVVVVSMGQDYPQTDRLRAALATGRAEFLHDVLQESELYQPLLDHLNLLHTEGRSQDWWTQAARIEPERRVRFTGPVTRQEFANLLAISDVFVLPGIAPRQHSQMLFEALACGVLPIAREQAGVERVAKLIADEISAEMASLCMLRSGMPPVQEIEQKLGRVVRLRPELASRLRALAACKFDGRQSANELSRLYAEHRRAAIVCT